MVNTGILASAEAAGIFFAGLLYIPISLLIYWRLMPSLSTPSVRLATVFLAAQVVVILLAQFAQPTTAFEEWLWDIDREWNVASALTSMQLGLVGGVALLTAWLARGRPAWQRLYFLSICLIFIFIGLDEFISWKSQDAYWHNKYIVVGLVFVAATLLVAARSTPQLRFWQIFLLVGLAVIALGAIGIDLLPRFCNRLGLWHLPICHESPFEEEVIEILGGWLTVVAMFGLFSQVAPTPKRRVRRLLYVFPALWLLLLMLASPIYSFSNTLPGQPAAVHFASGAQLYGYQLDSEGRPVEAYVYLPLNLNLAELGYSLHLVDQGSGKSIAGRDSYAQRDDPIWTHQKDYLQVSRIPLALEIPPAAPHNRALWIALSFWRERAGEYPLQKVLASDLPLLNETQVILGELVLPVPATAPATPIALFDNGFALAAVDLPEQARAGDVLSIDFLWQSSEPGKEDFAQFLHFVHAETGDWWGYDQLPLGPRLPTRLWYQGLADSENWQVPLPADLAPGRYVVFTGLYRVRDQERLPVTDAAGNDWLDGRVALGSIIIE